MANTVIQLKNSLLTNKPASLNIAEPAYSFSSNTLFIGTENNGVINIGGYLYTKTIDDATASAIANTLVERDANGSASFNVVTANTFTGTAATADKWTTAIDLGLAGDATGNVSFDGSANVTLTVDLTDTGVVAGTYGGTSNVPFFTVDVEGRLTAAGNTSISTNLAFNADTGGPGSLNLLSDTLVIAGGDGISTVANDTTNTVTVDVDNTVIRTSGDQTITGDITISGNLNVQGNTVTYDVDSYTVNDPIILLANNNPSNVVDIGFVAHYVEDEVTKHTGLVKNVATSTYYLFDNYGPHIQEDHLLDLEDPTLRTANLVANIVGGSISGLDTVITVSDGGTGANTFTTGQILVGNGSGALQSLANTGTAGTYANASHVPVITTDAYGRVSQVSNTAIAIDTAQITSGTLPIARGGTNQTTYTTGQRLVYNGTSLASQANTTTTITGALSAANTITSLTLNAYGEVTAYVGGAIAIDASQITTGILGVARGGSGAGTFTTNGVLLGNGTSAFNTASSSTEGHLLTINSSGVPTFTMLSGGTF